MTFVARILNLLFNLIFSTSILTLGAEICFLEQNKSCSKCTPLITSTSSTADYGNIRNYPRSYVYPSDQYNGNYVNAIPTNNGFNQGEMVDVTVYYECHCPSCRQVDSQQLVPLVQNIGEHINLRLVPYGNAQTEFKDGKLTFNCQHGPAECYGNKLHACAINELQNATAAVLFNSCMMDDSRSGLGSDDASADICSLSFGMNSESIKQCAKSDKGSLLLKQYGDESKAVGFKLVPHILVNGMKIEDTNIMRDVCRAFRNPPSGCRGVI